MKISHIYNEHRQILLHALWFCYLEPRLDGRGSVILKLALKVVESLLNIFVEKSLGDTRKDTTKTKQFIESQIKEYESRLLSAENRLKEFKRKNREFLSGSSGYFSRLTGAKNELRNAELLRILTEGNESVRWRPWLAAQTAYREGSFGVAIEEFQRALHEALGVPECSGARSFSNLVGGVSGRCLSRDTAEDRVHAGLRAR